MLDDFSELTFRPQLLAAGVSDDELRRLRERGRLVAVRPGAYLDADDPRLADAVAHHALAVRAAARALPVDAAVSHVSAAVLHGLTLWGVSLRRVHITRNRRTGGRCTARRHLHTAALDADEVTVVDGVPVTSVARTLTDLARTLPFEQALVTADAALHGHLVTAVAFADAVDRGTGRPGSPRARRVAAAADPRSESVGETRSRIAIARAGLPTPTLQHEFPQIGARVDFYWEEFGTVGEFDGKVKYGRALRPGQSPGDVVFAEKQREDALRDLGEQVARWCWGEIDPFDAAADRLWRAFARGAGRGTPQIRPSHPPWRV